VIPRFKATLERTDDEPGLTTRHSHSESMAMFLCLKGSDEFVTYTTLEVVAQMVVCAVDDLEDRFQSLGERQIKLRMAAESILNAMEVP